MYWNTESKGYVKTFENKVVKGNQVFHIRFIGRLPFIL